jgi:hypothetical protein
MKMIMKKIITTKMKKMKKMKINNIGVYRCGE